MIKQILLLFFLSAFIAENLDAKSMQLNDSIILPGKILKLIPKGYQVLDTAIGDLNLDKLQDLILVLKSNGENKTKRSTQHKRPLLILLGQADKSYTVRTRNDNAVYCIDCGGGAFGDAFSGVKIKNGYFSIEHGIAGGKHWEQVTTFKFDKSKGNWFLYKEHYVSYKFNESNDPNAEALVVDVDKLKTVKDFGFISFNKFNIYNKRGH